MSKNNLCQTKIVICLESLNSFVSWSASTDSPLGCWETAIGSRKSQRLLWDLFDYLNDWIFNIKYVNKFECVITSGLNYCNKDKNNQSLFDMLISQKHCGEKWFDLLLFKSLECMKQSGIALNDKKQSQEWIVKESILKECYQTCDNSKWKQIMQKYAK